MPGSVDEGKKETAEWLKKINPESILDVGAGIGTYAKLVHDNKILAKKVEAIEVWEPYIDYFKLNKMYTTVHKIDVRQWYDFNYDVVIFGDILEHMSKEDALAVWDRVSKQAKYAIISIPIIHYPQHAANNNPYEEHIKDDWTVEEVLESFNGIKTHHAFDIVGVFYAEFDN